MGQKVNPVGLRVGINPSRATPSAMMPGNDVPWESEDTTHFSVMDADGRSAEALLPVDVLDEGRTLAVEPLEEAFAGRPCRYRVSASAPGPVEVLVDDELVETVEVGDDLEAEVELSVPVKRHRVGVPGGKHLR